MGSDHISSRTKPSCYQLTKGKGHLFRRADGPLEARRLYCYADEVLPKMLAPRNIQALPACRRARARHHARHLPPRVGVAWPGPGHGYVEMLPDIAAPTLVGVGSDSDFTQVSDTQFMHERIKNSTLVMIEGPRTCPTWSEHQKFNGALHDFLESIPESR